MYNFRVFFLISSFFLLQGCAAFALSAGSMAAGQGVEYTLGGISYKTFASPVEGMRVATLKTLEWLDMKVIAEVRTKSGWEITATAYDRKIEIELEALTKRATRMRVVTHKGDLFFKDSATSTEIIIQTAETLEMEMEAMFGLQLQQPAPAKLARGY